VPVSLYPDFENWFGNMEIMPMTINRRKADRMGARQISHLATLRKALR